MSKRIGKAVTFLTRGFAIGRVATRALDRTSIFLYEREGKAERDRENRARGQLSAYERVAERTARALGVSLDREGIATWGNRVHLAFGWTAGLAFLALRRRNPRVAMGRGVAFGLGFFLLADELLLPLLRFSPGPRSFSWKVHGRGAAAHVAYGLAAERMASALEGPA